MGKIRLYIFLLILFTPCAVVFAQTVDLKLLHKSADDFSYALAESLPLNASLGLNWSDAYIGQLFSVRPHFGAGVSAGFATSGFDQFKKLAGLLGINEAGLLPGYVIIPSAVAEIRLGGILIPFDIGIKAGKFDSINVDGWASSSTLNHSLLFYGGDFRLALSKGLGRAPKISLGFGYNHLSGVMSEQINGSRVFSLNNTTITADDPRFEFFWNFSALDIKLQISKNILIFTPYIGAGALFFWSSIGYRIQSPLNSADSHIIDSALAAAGISGLIITKDGFSSTANYQAVSTRLFGGFSINLSIFRLDFTGLVSIPTFYFGGSVGLRFQIPNDPSRVKEQNKKNQ